MARRRSRTRRASSSSSFRKGKRSRGRKSSSGGAWQPLAYAGYGYARGTVSAKAREWVGGIVGNVGDEFLMLGVSWAAKKYGPHPLIRAAGNAGMNVELFNIGKMAAEGGLSSLLGGGSASGGANGLIVL